MFSDLVAALVSKKEMLVMRLQEREKELKELITQETVRKREFITLKFQANICDVNTLCNAARKFHTRT